MTRPLEDTIKEVVVEWLADQLEAYEGPPGAGVDYQAKARWLVGRAAQRLLSRLTP